MDCHFQERIGRRTGIASQALIPRKTPMRTLCSVLSLWHYAVLFLLRVNPLRGKNDGLRTKQLKPPTPDGTAWPITPQDWERSGFGRRWERLTQHQWSFGRWRRGRSRCGGCGGPNNGTDLPRLLRCCGFLTLISKRTGTAMTCASTIDHAYRAVALRSALLQR
jgi:hypothetical protein